MTLYQIIQSEKLLCLFLTELNGKLAISSPLVKKKCSKFIHYKLFNNKWYLYTPDGSIRRAAVIGTSTSALKETLRTAAPLFPPCFGLRPKLS